MKKCICCKLEKELNMFYKHKKTFDGVDTICKICVKEKAKLKYQQNPEKYQQRVKEFSNKNPEYNKQYYNQNKDYFKEKTLIFKEKNPNYSKEWLEKNPNYYYNWSQKSSSKQKAKQKQQEKLKNPIVRLKYSLQTRIRQGMFLVEGKKRKRTLEILGLESWDKFREYIESQWVEGMNWNNYGKNVKTDWSIDHTIPISSAKTEEEIYKLNHYTNLKPMWHIENIKKLNKLK